MFKRLAARAPLCRNKPPPDVVKDFHYSHSTPMRFAQYAGAATLSICFIWEVLLHRTNPFSQRKQLKFIAKPVQTNIVGPYVSRRVRKSFEKLIYKQDTPEVQFAKQVSAKIINYSDQLYFPPIFREKGLNVYVYHLPTVAITFFPPRELHINVKLFEFLTHEADRRFNELAESELGLMIASQLSAYLLDVWQARLFKQYRGIKKASTKGDESFDPQLIKLKNLQKCSKFFNYSYGYDKFTERACDTLAHQILDSCNKNIENQRQQMPFDRVGGVEVYARIEQFTTQDPITRSKRKAWLRQMGDILTLTGEGLFSYQRLEVNRMLGRSKFKN